MRRATYTQRTAQLRIGCRAARPPPQAQAPATATGVQARCRSNSAKPAPGLVQPASLGISTGWCTEHCAAHPCCEGRKVSLLCRILKVDHVVLATLLLFLRLMGEDGRKQPATLQRKHAPALRLRAQQWLSCRPLGSSAARRCAAQPSRKQQSRRRKVPRLSRAPTRDTGLGRPTCPRARHQPRPGRYAARECAPGDSCRSSTLGRSSVVLCGTAGALRAQPRRLDTSPTAHLQAQRRRTGSLVAADSEMRAPCQGAEAGCPATTASARRKRSDGGGSLTCGDTKRNTVRWNAVGSRSTGAYTC